MSVKLGVVGCGQMGIGIAQVGLISRLKVQIYDKNSSFLESQVNFMNKLLTKDVQKSKITLEQKEEALSNLSICKSMEEFDSDFVVEAVSENLETKKSIFKQLSQILPNSILATNTSSISITKIASSTQSPEKVIGMHFMNPVPVMKLVEVIPGLRTEKSTLNETMKLVQTMNKVSTVSKDINGFIANRLLMPYINEAILLLQQGIASREDIDTTMKLGTNVPMGPLQLADFIGLDTCLAIMQVLNELGDKYRPADLLKQYVDAGYLGKKSGQGFYIYSK